MSNPSDVHKLIIVISLLVAQRSLNPTNNSRLVSIEDDVVVIRYLKLIGLG